VVILGVATFFLRSHPEHPAIRKARYSVKTTKIVFFIIEAKGLVAAKIRIKIRLSANRQDEKIEFSSKMLPKKNVYSHAYYLYK